MFIRDVIHYLAGLPDGPSVGYCCMFDFHKLAIHKRTSVFDVETKSQDTEDD
jgi:hypothetical protein